MLKHKNINDIHYIYVFYKHSISCYEYFNLKYKIYYQLGVQIYLEIVDVYNV